MKPLLRGYIHRAAFFIALFACAILILKSHGTKALIANLIYSFSLVGLYCASALYHSFYWGFKARYVMRCIDHSAIFGLIAGTATPICLLGLSPHTGNELLIILWSIAGIGMLLSGFWGQESAWIRASLYVAMGWFCLPFISEIKISLGSTNAWLLLDGGIIYTIGAIIYACKKPNPIPGIFGYHEVFHSLVVIASGFHFIVIYHLAELPK